MQCRGSFYIGLCAFWDSKPFWQILQNLSDNCLFLIFILDFFNYKHHKFLS
ncbi:hypothetical protein SPAR111_0622 [Streptococcus pneumoniae GA49194]|nr:hypothetical protein SPMLV016_0569 [Streptococcus pneumoniae MLV-016]EGI87528.1 hypothetical protein SPAR148_0599 [Streptococcus pneumoniae GA17545]EGJ16581.1 hypothetical protein SPAR69_0623 [Streptococcus pneumoniae GA41317]EHE03145.1 hypothetical protein SPAR39_0635 [Streptococcus pneumoniae GA16242]EHE32000.1 hypothetical protein SPAR91_0601 [Streptococcus pneumoniae GA47283]EHY96987.1 hypothetical protein SPAR1_1334 [Streptococcus pneumoniae GA02254]EHZ10470.1 hypothetical protein SPA